MDSMKIEPLGRNISVEINKVHSFGEDALALAGFSLPRDGERACELGCGCGVISLIWCRDARPAAVDAVEIQSDAAEMAARSAAVSGLEQIIKVYCADLKSWKPPSGGYDLVAMNPPYFEAGRGKPSNRLSDRISRHEGEGCGFPDIAGAASRLLRSGGRFCFCHRPERLCDLTDILRQNRLEPKTIQLVATAPGEKPWLLLCEARKCAGSGVDITMKISG